MKRSAPLLSASVALACLSALPAHAFTPERAGIMVDAVRANGCQMAGSEAAGALEPLGLDAVEVQSFVEVLYMAELVTLSDDSETLMLSEALCSLQGESAMQLIVAAFEAQEVELAPWTPDFEPARGAALIDVIRDNGCAMTDEQAAEILPGHDFDPVITRDIMSVLLETERASVSDDGASVRLAEALCAADPAQDVAAMEAALADWFAANPSTGEANQ